MKNCEDKTIENKIKRLEYKLDIIFDTLEQIKLDLEEEKWDKRIAKTSEEKTNMERALKDMEMCKNSRWDRLEDDRKRYQGIGDCEVRCDGCI